MKNTDIMISDHEDMSVVLRLTAEHLKLTVV